LAPEVVEFARAELVHRSVPLSEVDAELILSGLEEILPEFISTE